MRLFGARRLNEAHRDGLRDYLDVWGVSVPYTDARLATWASDRRKALRTFADAIDRHGGQAPDWLS
jgi:hypothetical protein